MAEMTYEHWLSLEKQKDSKLTDEEIKQGWHWCPDWDYLLVGPGMDELLGCTCKNDGRNDG